MDFEKKCSFKNVRESLEKPGNFSENYLWEGSGIIVCIQLFICMVLLGVAKLGELWCYLLTESPLSVMKNATKALQMMVSSMKIL